MGPIQKAVREGGDAWIVYVDGLHASVSRDHPLYSSLREAHYSNIFDFDASLADIRRMRMSTKYGRLFQKGF